MCQSTLLVWCQVLSTWAWKGIGRVLHWHDSGKKQKVFVFGVANLEYTTNTKLISFKSFELSLFTWSLPQFSTFFLFPGMLSFGKAAVWICSLLNWTAVLLQFLVLLFKGKDTTSSAFLPCSLDCLSLLFRSYPKPAYLPVSCPFSFCKCDDSAATGWIWQ